MEIKGSKTEKKDKERYPVFCSWCFHWDGIRKIVRYTSVKGSWGICEEHKKQLLEQCKKYQVVNVIKFN